MVLFPDASKPNRLRLDIVDMVYAAGSGHLGGSLSLVEILIALYDRVLRHDPLNPNWAKRDRLILSKGHAAPALYAILADQGYFPTEERKTLRRLNSILQGHPDMNKTPGVDFSSGSLGQGLAVGLGKALALTRCKSDARVYVILGDGELNEGQIWETALSASKFRARNLTAIVDRNHVQLDGTSEDIMPLEPLAEKWRAFGWTVVLCDGHDRDDVERALRAANAAENPAVVLAETVKGKGVPFMEGRYKWHGGVMTDDEYKSARAAIMETMQ